MSRKANRLTSPKLGLITPRLGQIVNTFITIRSESSLMGIDTNFDTDKIMNSIVDEIEKIFIQHVEEQIENGSLDCECGSQEFDVEVWQSSNDSFEGAAICRDCNDRAELDIDTSEIDSLRR